MTQGVHVGKSYTLRCVIDALKQKYGTSFTTVVARTASTGIAAIQVEGMLKLLVFYTNGVVTQRW